MDEVSGHGRGARRWSWGKLGQAAKRCGSPALCVVICVVGCGLLYGCGTQTIVKTVVATATSSTSAPASSAGGSTSSSDQSQQAGVGDTLTLTGNGGEKVAVTIDQVMDPLAVGPDDQADSGQRFVGVQLTLKNVGSVVYSDSPSNGATLLSNTNEQAQGEIVTGGPCGNDFQSSVNIAPGDTEQGCVPFEMPTGQNPSSFQFTLSSGFADQTGQWSLAGSTSAVAPSASESSQSTQSTQSSPAGSPLSTLSSYWHAIGAHQFSIAYALLAPGAVSLTESQFVSGEQQAGIGSAKFSGTVASNSGSTGTVQVKSLITHDAQYGCRSWTGSYEMTDQGGSWQIEKASITPSSCG